MLLPLEVLAVTYGKTGESTSFNGDVGTTGGFYINDTQISSADLSDVATFAKKADKLSVFAATTSTELAGVISDETGTDKLVYNTSPTFVTPVLGTPTSGTLTNCTGLPIAGGGTGQSTAQTAINALTDVAGATDEHVLTKDTATGNAIFKAAAGGVTSAFQARPTQAQNDFSSTTNVVWGTEIFDTGNNFASNTFTAPITGKYSFQVSLDLLNLDTATVYYQLKLVTSNRTYLTMLDTTKFSADIPYWTMSLNVIADMDASDTAYVQIVQNGGTTQTDISVGSWFSGAFIGT